ncbi:prolyl oligopeptidase family serine peptidase [Sphingomonas quercus]|uniref:Prolyl oligopeptidase family serine peptidase n=1 Tax=Sphingomonas quercus TaxID=2842451 RepID=A0ABS6BMV4_9SPHN|nr:prolyl oligopeptidase family serine peptidase [Sphingomonas quercus]MBU3078711.1 prolyl oligopeptidase family serine peptidase [Sphingomonas quercus]
MTAAPALAATPFAYPQAARGDTVDTAFGQSVADPYRWLENDVRTDPRVRDWVDAENKVTDAYLATLPGRDAIRARLTRLWNYERFGTPVKRGSRYFYAHNSGLQNQSVLYVREGLDGAARLLVDPNEWARDGATALAEWTPSEDGRRIAYAVQDGGTDWRIIRVLDVDTGKETGDEVRWAKFSGATWAKDGSGFYYTRFPEPAPGEAFQSVNLNARLWFHRLGTPQAADTLVYETPDHPTWGHYPEVTEDGRWLVISTSEGTDPRNDITLIDLAAPGSAPRHLFTGISNQWSLVGSQGNRFWFQTDLAAPRGRIVEVDVDQTAPKPVEIIGQDKATLERAGLIGGRLISLYLVDAHSEARLFALDGKPAGTVKLPGIGTIGAVTGRETDPEAFFAFSSFNMPPRVMRLDMTSGATATFTTPEVAFSPDDYVVEERFYPSKDGTQVPLFIVHRKGLDLSKGAPTLLYGYGGFNVSLTPAFSPRILAWLEMGGVYAQASLRGGGEYGNAWHDAGRLARKQNVFDDFIAAGEYLKREGIASALVAQGGSNGGLLVGAVVNQRPDLWAAALPAVGVMDMLRFDRFTAGRYWVDDYGYPDREADWKVLRAYSPYHNIRPGVAYPPILVTTADTDDRVVPGHSFKYTAALQAADLGDKPHLIRIETRAGHGSGKPTDKAIAETADLWAFAAHWSGLAVPTN